MSEKHPNDRWERGAKARVLDAYQRLHKGKLGMHWMWAAILRVVHAGETEQEALEDFGYVPDRAADRAELVKRLRRVVVTMNNDDYSTPGTEKRQRHCERLNAVGAAIDFLEGSRPDRHLVSNALSDVPLVTGEDYYVDRMRQAMAKGFREADAPAPFKD